MVKRAFKDSADGYYETEIPAGFPVPEWATGMSEIPVQPPAALTEDQLLAQAKIARAEAVAAIIVTTSQGHDFDGDERSQDRMARAIVAMGEGDSIQWVLADNSVVIVTQEELRDALRMAGARMAEEWVKPYTGE